MEVVDRLQQLCPRGQIEYEIRASILEGGRVLIPEDWSPFWKWWKERAEIFNSKCSRSKPKLLPRSPFRYDRVRQAGIAWSGGAESQILKAIFPSVPRFRMKASKLWTDPAEGAIAIVGAGLGFNTVFFGAELEPGEKVGDETTAEPYFFECGNEFQKKWHEHSGVHFLAPLSAMLRRETTLRCFEAGIPFYSCWHWNKLNKKFYCGECKKCLQLKGYGYTIKGGKLEQLSNRRPMA